MDTMVWAVAGLFYLPLHLGLPALWLFYRLLDDAAELRAARLRRFLIEGVVMLVVTVGLAAAIWQAGLGLAWLVGELLLATALPFWRARVLSS